IALESLRLFIFHHSSTAVSYTLSLHDALPILVLAMPPDASVVGIVPANLRPGSGNPASSSVMAQVTVNVIGSFLIAVWHREEDRDRKSTRLNSSHVAISYAVFCLKKKNNPKWR